jgi:hypothetical protein
MSSYNLTGLKAEAWERYQEFLTKLNAQIFDPDNTIDTNLRTEAKKKASDRMKQVLTTGKTGHRFNRDGTPIDRGFVARSAIVYLATCEDEEFEFIFTCEDIEWQVFWEINFVPDPPEKPQQQQQQPPQQQRGRR